MSAAGGWVKKPNSDKRKQPKPRHQGSPTKVGKGKTRKKKKKEALNPCTQQPISARVPSRKQKHIQITIAEHYQRLGVVRLYSEELLMSMGTIFTSTKIAIAPDTKEDLAALIDAVEAAGGNLHRSVLEAHDANGRRVFLYLCDTRLSKGGLMQTGSSYESVIDASPIYKDYVLMSFSDLVRAAADDSETWEDAPIDLFGQLT